MDAVTAMHAVTARGESPGTVTAARGRQLALANGAARGALGLVAMVAPSIPLAPWVGHDGDEPAGRLLARALGFRDLALASGLMWALTAHRPARPWLLAAALADAGDVVVTLGSFRSLPARGRWAVLGAATGGVATALAAAYSVDRPLGGRR